MHNTKSPARMSQGRLPRQAPILGFETTRPIFEDSETAPLSISRKRHTASGGAIVHESVSMPSAHPVGTAFKTHLRDGIQGFKVGTVELKSSKESVYLQSLSFTASDAHEFESSKHVIGREPSSKDSRGVLA